MTIEVGFLEDARMEESQPADAGGGEIGCGGSTHATDAGDEDGGKPEALLLVDAEAGNRELALEAPGAARMG